MSSNNPYESPLAVESSEQETPDGLHAIGIGFLGGAFVGGTAGAVQGAVLAAITIFSLVSEKGSTVMDAAVVGVMAATIVGALFGALVGCASWLRRRSADRWRRPSIRAELKTVPHGAGRDRFHIRIGHRQRVAIRFLTGRELELSALRYVVAVFSAILTGFVGGVVMVRGMIRLIWPASVSELDTEPAAE